MSSTEEPRLTLRHKVRKLQQTPVSRVRGRSPRRRGESPSGIHRRFVNSCLRPLTSAPAAATLRCMEIPIPDGVRELLEAPNYAHLSTLRADGSPRNWVVWVGLEGEHVLICTSDAIWKAKDMRRDARVALSVTDGENPYRMAAIQGRVVEVRRDEGCRYMDPISYEYTGAPFPSRGPDRVCFVIAVEKAAQRTLSFTHKPGMSVGVPDVPPAG